MTARRAGWRAATRPAITLTVAACSLAVGVSLGAGPLSELSPSAVRSTGESAPPPDETAEETAGGFPDAFAEAASAALLGDRLAGRQVALVVLPGAEDDVVDGIDAQVRTAGGVVAARYAVRPGLVDAGEKALVDALGLQLDDQLPDRMVRRAAPTYVRLGQLLAAAVGTEEERATPVRPAGVTVRQSLAGADLLELPEGEPSLAPWVLVVLPPEPGPDGGIDDAILAGLVQGLAERTRGVVVAGDTGSADLVTLRDEPAAERVSTVDGIDAAAGRVAAVLALARRTEGVVGAFGASGSDGALPLG